MNATDNDGYTPLHYATLNREEDCVAVLLAHGADVHKSTSSGYTAMTYAVILMYEKIIEMLKQAGG